jgi:hypothetical protein
VWPDFHRMVRPGMSPTNIACAAMSRFGIHVTCPLRIMLIVSIPCSVLHAARKDRVLTRSRAPLYSSVILFDDIAQVSVDNDIVHLRTGDY